MRYRPALTAFFLMAFLTSAAQGIDSSDHLRVSEKYLETIIAKSSKTEEALAEKGKKTIAALKKEEEKLYKKLYKLDSAAAKSLFGESQKKYEDIIKKLGDAPQVANELRPGNYIPFLDSIKTSLGFLEGKTNLFAPGAENAEKKIKEAIDKANVLKGRFDQAASVQKFIRERRQYLKEQLSKFGLAKDLKRLNKQAYYYSQMIRDYKEIFSDPKKIEKHVLALLNEIPAFKNFMQRNSMLASIFGVPSSGGTAISIAGLQTRASVQQVVSRTIPGATTNPASFISGQLQAGNSQLASLKSKIAFVDLSGSPEQMPDFKPNTQKTKPLIKRLELGTNVQFGKSNQLLPSIGDFALSLAYKLNDNGSIGVGSSYKLGFGSLQSIRFTHQGYGFRSFIDWKIKGGFYISGGYEKNYLPQLQNVLPGHPLQSWQESGLLGISKRIQAGKKKKISFQLLFDMLSYKNIPRSQPVIFRTGWIF